MPLKNKEYISILSNQVESIKLITDVKTSFDKLSKEFDNNWREDIINGYL